VVFTSTNFADCVALIFLNSVLTKTLEIASSFFRIFISFFQKKIKKLNSQVYQKPMKPVQTDFCKKPISFQLVFQSMVGRDRDRSNQDRIFFFMGLSRTLSQRKTNNFR
jgi:hypothetical protein